MASIWNGTNSDDTFSAYREWVLVGQFYTLVWNSWIISGSGGNDTLTGGDNIDTLFGEDGNDFLYGLAGNDQLYGGAGNDYLDGGIGNDSLYGGTGNDTFVINSSTDAVYEIAVDGGIDLVNSSVTHILSSFVENLTLTGTNAINGTGNTLNNTIRGNNGNNDLSGLDGNDSLFGEDGNDSLDGFSGNDNLYGGIGNDTLWGSSGDNFLDGGEGNDFVNGSINSDTVYGGNGNDFLTGADSNDSLYGGTNNDTLYGGSGNDLLYGEDGNDTLYGDTGNDYLYGQIGDDYLTGGSGNDYFSGGTGNDTLVVDSTSDFVNELFNEGIDTIRSTISYTLSSNLENLTLMGNSSISGTGNSLNNIITANNSGNSLYGGGGSDVINGGAGTDVLMGGNILLPSTGIDSLTGGSSGDSFALGDFFQSHHISSGNSDYALITDFDKTQDKILLSFTSQSTYTLGSSPIVNLTGTAIYFSDSSHQSELIAIVQGVTGLNLNESYFVGSFLGISF